MALGKDGWIRLVQIVDDSGTPTGGGGGAGSKSAWASNVKNVAVPGTAEQLQSLVAPTGYAIVVKAKSGNTDLVYIGNSQANAQDVTKRVSLSAGQAAVLLVTNANLAWVDAAIAGEGVEAFVEQ